MRFCGKIAQVNVLVFVVSGAPVDDMQEQIAQIGERLRQKIAKKTIAAEMMEERMSMVARQVRAQQAKREMVKKAIAAEMLEERMSLVARQVRAEQAKREVIDLLGKILIEQE